ncbi:uncharacterized protein A4U43_C01F24940 [Asparagus officinalis]|uniref:Uncharacterized protein n=1 Tax=Asparagus officinalis TaxID=4686 RepID=A0A5P1FST2_ASPOF|nr:uncharacterized protein A4U43_C01F24940 [Asparagus officinalis]
MLTYQCMWTIQWRVKERGVKFPNPIRSTPKKYKKVASKKKLTPKRRIPNPQNPILENPNIISSLVKCQTTIQSPSPLHENPLSTRRNNKPRSPINENLSSSPHNDNKLASSNDNDDSVEDETYEMNPTELVDDDEFDGLGLVDEFIAQGEMNERINSTASITQLYFSVMTKTNDNEATQGKVGEEDGNVSDNSVAAMDEEAQEALNSENDDLHEIRHRDKELLNAVKGKIAVSSGAKLSNNDNDPHLNYEIHSTITIDDGGRESAAGYWLGHRAEEDSRGGLSEFKLGVWRSLGRQRCDDEERWVARRAAGAKGAGQPKRWRARVCGSEQAMPCRSASIGQPRREADTGWQGVARIWGEGVGCG